MIKEKTFPNKNDWQPGYKAKRDHSQLRKQGSSFVKYKGIASPSSAQEFKAC